MKKEGLIKRNKDCGLNELHAADSQSSSLSCQVSEKQATDSSLDFVGSQPSQSEDESGDSSYIIDLLTSLDKKGEELTMTQSEVQSLLSETDELLSEYKVTVKAMKDRLADRKNKLRKPKA